jgi:hypothetical protein
LWLVLVGERVDGGLSVTFAADRLVGGVGSIEGLEAWKVFGGRDGECVRRGCVAEDGVFKTLGLAVIRLARWTSWPLAWTAERAVPWSA